jgi:hypothetical protein
MDGSSLSQLKNQIMRLKQERDELMNDTMEERNIVAGME